jgi:serine/threonine protein phosphatase PrpC
VVTRAADSQSATVTVANAGACRAVLSRYAPDGGGAHACVELSVEHRPSLAAEKRRVLLADSRYTVDSRGRIGGTLAISRALGSTNYKRQCGLAPSEQVLTATPDVRVASGIVRGDVLLLATDGVWDCLSTDEALASVRRSRSRLGSAAATSAVCAAVIADCLRGSTRAGRGSDNMTMLLVEFE